MKTAKSLSLKFLCVFMLLFVAMSFCACAEVRTMTITNEDGTIDEVVNIVLDRRAVEANGQDFEQVKTKIEQGCAEVCDQILDELKIRAFLSPGKRVFADSITPYSSKTWKDDTYAVCLRFESEQAYDFYYNRTDGNAIEPQTEHHFLYDKIIYTGYTTFAQSLSLFGHLKTYFEDNYADMVDLTGGKLKYTIATDVRREHSDADYVEKLDGRYYHTWVLEPNETDAQINLYYNVANRSNCILVCVLAGLAVCAVLLLVGFILTKIGKKAE